MIKKILMSSAAVAIAASVFADGPFKAAHLVDLSLHASVATQGFRGMRGMMNSPAMLLNREDVRDDLKLSDDQKNKLAALRESTQTKMRDVFQNNQGDRDAIGKAMEPIMKEANDSALAILTPDQQKRLKEIGYQLSGYGILATDKDIQAALGLTDDQKSKIGALSKQADEANASVGEKMRNGDLERDAAMQAYQKNRDALNAGIEGILTADQKTKFKAMQGATFTATSQPFGGGGFRGGGGGGN